MNPEDRHLTAAPTSLPSPTDVPTQFGPYRLLQKLGEGGMGEVWLAEQLRPIHRQVAVKIIKLGMDTREVVARFEAERQALALMDHAAIARVLDCGSTPEGRPYFVMEYVAGVAITDHCDRLRLPISERLKLFTEVCAAVQHAHHKAIIHRDLKPSNVLVAIQNDTAVLKIIDFGLAKATALRLTDKTLFTQIGVVLGTPEYMSPEQAELTGQDVDTRTDVYALGVMLYELLTGVRPITVRDPGTSLDEIRRRIREEEPPKPSSRINLLGDKADEVAERRQATVPLVARQLSGDLDWITMKALEKDRTCRYGSPSELAADIGRHLADEPVLAGPASTAYRARRFVRRHRFGVGAAAAAAVLLLVFAVTMAVLADRIAQERDRANQQAQSKERVAEFLKELFRVSDPSQARGNTVTAREILDQGVSKLGQTLKDAPEVRADLADTLGDVYSGLGLFSEAERLTRDALVVRRQLLGDEHASTLETTNRLTWLALQQGRYAEAEQLGVQVAVGAERQFGPDDPRTLAAKNRLANVFTHQGRLREADPLLSKVADTQRRVLGDDHSDTLATLNNLALLYNDLGRFDDATKLNEEVLERRTRVLGADHPDILTSMNNLAYGYQKLGRYDDARELLERAMAIGERIWGSQHPIYGTIVHTLGELEMAAENRQTAETRLLQALALYKLQPSHQHIPLVLYQLAQISALQGKPDRALDFLADALAAGYQHQRDPMGFVKDPSFAALRSRARFAALVADARTRGAAN